MLSLPARPLSECAAPRRQFDKRLSLQHLESCRSRMCWQWSYIVFVLLRGEMQSTKLMTIARLAQASLNACRADGIIPMRTKAAPPLETAVPCRGGSKRRSMARPKASTRCAPWPFASAKWLATLLIVSLTPWAANLRCTESTFALLTCASNQEAHRYVTSTTNDPHRQSPWRYLC